MTLIEPPADLRRPNCIDLKKGTRFERVHASKFTGNDFNPCQGGRSRFAPIHDLAGNCVPSLYAGSTTQAAIYETIFHDIPDGPGRKSIPASSFQDRAHSVLQIERTLTLANLRNPDLVAWGINTAQLISSHASTYAKTALWAQAIHHQFDSIDGLAWTSRRSDPADAFLLFGDRVSPSDLRILSVRQLPLDLSFLDDIKEAADRSEIEITV